MFFSTCAVNISINGNILFLHIRLLIIFLLVNFNWPPIYSLNKTSENVDLLIYIWFLNSRDLEHAREDNYFYDEKYLFEVKRRYIVSNYPWLR